jgi:tRNA/rRNA methyltransferase
MMNVSPIVILVCPQMAENIGMCARAMANFGVEEMRLVAPRDGWPNRKALAASSGAHWILENALCFETLEEALADCTLSFALTARQHGQFKPVVHPVEAMSEAQTHISRGEKVAFIFGRERNGLESGEVALADKIVTLPVNPKFSSLNLAQAVMLIVYEWSRVVDMPLPFTTSDYSPPATKEQLFSFFNRFEGALDEAGFFRPAEKVEVMKISLRNIINRMNPTHQDIQTLSGAIAALKSVSRETVYSPNMAGLKEIIHNEIAMIPETGTPLKGLTRLLRRNPSLEERQLWAAIVAEVSLNDAGIKRAIPVGPHIADFVSMKKRFVIEIMREEEDVKRNARHEWFMARAYKVLVLDAAQIKDDLKGVMMMVKEAI